MSSGLPPFPIFPVLTGPVQDPRHLGRCIRSNSLGSYDLYTFLYHVVFNKMLIKVKNINRKQEGSVRNAKDVGKVVIYLRGNKIWEEKVCIAEGSDKSCSGWVDKVISVWPGEGGVCACARARSKKASH